MKRTQILINKPVYLGLSILEKVYGLWYDFVNLMLKTMWKIVLNGKNRKIEIENIYVDIAKDFETKLNTSSYELKKPSSKKIKLS